LNELKIIVGISVLLVSVLFVNEAFADSTGFLLGDPKRFSTNSSSASTCPIGTSSSDVIKRIRYDGLTTGFCRSPTFAFDISSIPNSTVITNMTLRIDVLGGSLQQTIQIFQITKDPSIMTDQEGTDSVFQRAGGFNGTIYISSSTFGLTSGLDKLIVLPITAHTDLRESLLQGQSEFFLAINYEDLVTRGNNQSEVIFDDVELQVTFDSTPPVISTTVPQPIPFGITEQDSQKILLTASQDIGGVTVSDETGFNEEVHLDTLDALVPQDSKVHAVSLFSKGFVDADTAVGIYTGTTLLGDLGIKHITLDNSGNQTVTWFANPPIIKPFQSLRVGWITNCNVPIGCTQNQWLGVAGLEIDRDAGNTFPNLPNPFVKTSDLTLNIGHAIIYQEPSNFDSFDEFDSVTCIDDTDGDITRSMTTVGSVDTSIAKGYTITYTCTDRASNQSQLEIQYIIKRKPTSGISVSTTQQPVGGVQEVPKASDIAPLSLVPSEPREPPRRTLDEVFDLFSLLFGEAEPIPTLEFVPEPESVTDIPAPLSQPPTPTEEIRPSFIESIQNFFAGLFG